MSSVSVTLVQDPLDEASWTNHDVPDLCDFLREQWKQFPDTGRIYHKQVSHESDVTPHDEKSIELLKTLPGPFYIVIYPGNPGVILAVQILIAVVAVALAPSVPDVPNAAARNQSAASPNNELSDRTNRARINGRICDIFGTVRSTPDLLALPYKRFVNNREVEYAYMCIGRGYYEVSDIRDGDTLASNIPGTSVEVYAPFTSPNSGDDPQLRIGNPIRTPVWNVRRNNSVNGQVLRPPNPSTFTGSGNVRFVAPNIIELFPGTADDLTKFFVEGDELTVTGATMTTGVAVDETVQCRATVVTLRQAYFKSLPPHYEYNTSGGALVFELSSEAVVNAMFVPGSDIILTQTAGDSRFSGLDLSGTYEIDTVSINEPTAQQISRGVKRYVIVKLVDPATVNADWDDAQVSDDSWDWVNDAPRLTFTLSLDAAESYDLDLDDTYDILSVTKEQIILDNPVAVNADWAIVATNGLTPYLSPTLSTSTAPRWIGPFILREPDTTRVLANLVAQNGLYKDDGTDQFAVDVEVELEVTPVDNDDEPLAASELFQITLRGSTTLKETVAVSLEAIPSSFYGRNRVRMRRVTETDEAFEGTVVDEVRWRDVYSMAAVEPAEFGNVTTVQTITFATASALAVKERKLNMIVQRMLPTFDGTNFDDETLAVTENAADIFVAICRDKYLGNRQLAEINVANIYATIAEIEAYFGHIHATQFSYTFDNDNISFEEMLTIVANAIHSVAYRRGNIFNLSFEKQTDDSVLLFNHRNKMPATETRTQKFGYADDNDGIELAYVNPADDSIITIFLPLGYPSVNPKRIETIGVRRHLQAYFIAWRAWNKIQHQNMFTEFEGLQEAELLVRNDRILVADSTRPNTQDGEVVAVAGLVLTLSKRVDLTQFTGYTIFLQHANGTVESIGITAGSDSTKVVLDDAPLFDLVVDPEGYARTTFIILGVEETQQLPFLFQEREPQSKMTSTVRASIYDERFYANDLDFINELIDENGYGPSGGWTPGPDTPPYNGGEDGPSLCGSVTTEAMIDAGDTLDQPGFGYRSGSTSDPSNSFFGGQAKGSATPTAQPGDSNMLPAALLGSVKMAQLISETGSGQTMALIMDIYPNANTVYLRINGTLYLFGSPNYQGYGGTKYYTATELLTAPGTLTVCQGPPSGIHAEPIGSYPAMYGYDGSTGALVLDTEFLDGNITSLIWEDYSGTPGDDYLTLTVDFEANQNDFTSVTIGGHTLLAADATFGGGVGFSTWTWPGTTGTDLPATGTTYHDITWVFP